MRTRAGRLDTEYEIADVDLIAVLYDQGRCDLATIHIRAVGALEIDDDELAVFEHDAGVTFRDVSFGQDDVVALNTPNGHLGFVEFEATLVSTFFGDDDGEHSGPFGCDGGDLPSAFS